MAAKKVKFPKKLMVHFYWLGALALVVASLALVYAHRERKALREALADLQQTLNECQYSFEVWNSQIESGEVRVLKTDKDGTKIMYRWTLSKENADDTWILK